MTLIGGFDRPVTIAAVNICPWLPTVYLGRSRFTQFHGTSPWNSRSWAEIGRTGAWASADGVTGAATNAARVGHVLEDTTVRFCTALPWENSKANSVVSEKQKKSREKITGLPYLREFRFFSLSLDAVPQGTLEDKPFVSPNLAAFLRVILVVVVNIKSVPS